MLQLRDLFLLSQAPPTVGSSEGLWHPCFRIAVRYEIVVYGRSEFGEAKAMKWRLLNMEEISG
jgi:hypothetical protein